MRSFILILAVNLCLIVKYRGCVMKKIMFLVSLLLLASSAYADDRILGKWKGKTEPFTYQYEFKKNHDFIYTWTWIDGETGEIRTDIKNGVWEIGSWTLTDFRGNESTCSLEIYTDEMHCCFEYKFIVDNLIMRNVYKSSSSIICKKRILRRETKEEE